MMLFTKANLAKLKKNAELADSSKVKPVVKLFNPTGAGTWLISEYHEEDDVLFGLCDLGFGTPELGYVSLGELKSFRGRFGLGIERDRSFTPKKTLSEYAEDAYGNGSINV